MSHDLMNPNVCPELKLAAVQAAAMIEYEFQRFLPGRQCSAKIRHILGDFMQISINMLKPGEKPANNIELNAPGYCVFMMSLSDDFGRPLKVGDELRVNCNFGSPAKFRLIKANSPKAAAEKFLKWLEKNADAFIACNP